MGLGRVLEVEVVLLGRLNLLFLGVVGAPEPPIATRPLLVSAVVLLIMVNRPATMIAMAVGHGVCFIL